MKLACTLCCGLLLAVAIVNANPIVKRETNDLNPLNEVYVVQADDSLADDERGDRDKRKIGIVKLGVSNGILNFVFGKLDSFLDSKTKALAALDEGNKAKNAAFGIDATQSATGQFINNLISQKIQAGTASIGPLISGATTFLSSASSGLGNVFASKLGPLSGILGGLSGSSGDGSSGGGLLSGGLGGLLSSKIETISSLSSGSSLGGGSGGLDAGASIGGGGAGAGISLGGGTGGAGAGISLGGGSGGTGGGLDLGAFANLGGALSVPTTVSTTTEDIPEFNRVHVSLDVPPPVFGSGFTVITNISKVLSSVITNSARRTESLLELFKPAFRGAFAIKGLPSDRKQ